jgi:hypothetical protein
MVFLCSKGSLRKADFTFMWWNMGGPVVVLGYYQAYLTFLPKKLVISRLYRYIHKYSIVKLQYCNSLHLIHPKSVAHVATL